MLEVDSELGRVRTDVNSGIIRGGVCLDCSIAAGLAITQGNGFGKHYAVPECHCNFSQNYII